MKASPQPQDTGEDEDIFESIFLFVIPEMVGLERAMLILLIYSKKITRLLLECAFRTL